MRKCIVVFVTLMIIALSGINLTAQISICEDSNLGNIIYDAGDSLINEQLSPEDIAVVGQNLVSVAQLCYNVVASVTPSSTATVIATPLPTTTVTTPDLQGFLYTNTDVLTYLFPGTNDTANENLSCGRHVEVIGERNQNGWTNVVYVERFDTLDSEDNLIREQYNFWIHADILIGALRDQIFKGRDFPVDAFFGGTSLAWDEQNRPRYTLPDDAEFIVRNGDRFNDGNTSSFLDAKIYLEPLTPGLDAFWVRPTSISHALVGLTLQLGEPFSLYSFRNTPQLPPGGTDENLLERLNVASMGSEPITIEIINVYQNENDPINNGHWLKARWQRQAWILDSQISSISLGDSVGVTTNATVRDTASRTSVALGTASFGLQWRVEQFVEGRVYVVPDDGQSQLSGWINTCLLNLLTPST